MINKDLLMHLKAVRENALAKYSNFKVGAVLITNDGKKFSGFNIESSSYGLTICAERVALFKALSEGERKFKEIYKDHLEDQEMLKEIIIKNFKMNRNLIWQDALLEYGLL